MVAVSTRRTVTRLASPGVRAAREVYLSCPIDLLRVAALVDIAGAAASLARTVVKLRHLDPVALSAHVADPTDLRAVLGRGRWLPTMTRHIGQPTTEPAPVFATPPRAASVQHRAARRAGNPNQLTLFTRSTGAGEVATPCH